MKAEVMKRFEFDAAHWLPGYKGKCSNVHGHHWLIDVCLVGEIGRKTGMVIDFNWISESMASVIEMFDHHCLNDIIPNPTAENIAVFVLCYIRDECIQGPTEGISIKYIRVWESESSYAEVSGK